MDKDKEQIGETLGLDTPFQREPNLASSSGPPLSFFCFSVFCALSVFKSVSGLLRCLGVLKEPQSPYQRDLVLMVVVEVEMVMGVVVMVVVVGAGFHLPRSPKPESYFC